MAELLIRLKKHRDGSAALSCERADGSVTWQRHRGTNGHFFALHDLTHYAVETTLAVRRGFFGLLADGWGVTDFGVPWPKGPLPPEAARIELIVGFLDTERAGGGAWSVEQFNEYAVRFCATHALDGAPELSEGELERLRHVRDELFAEWMLVPAGESFELEFDRSTSSV